MDRDAQPEEQVYPVTPAMPKWLTGIGIVFLLLTLLFLRDAWYLLMFFGPLGAGLIAWGEIARRQNEAAWRLDGEWLTVVSMTGHRTRVAWDEVLRLETVGARAVLWTRDMPLPIPTGVADREGLLLEIRQRLAERRPAPADHRLDLSPLIGEDEVVSVRHAWNPWAFAGVVAGALLVLALWLWLMVKGHSGGLTYMVFMMFGWVVAAWAQRNRIAFDRDGLQITTPKRSEALSWAEVEGLDKSDKGWSLKTRTGAVAVLKSHENAERLVEVVHEVLRAKTDGLTVPGATGAAPTALSRTRMASDEPADRAVSRVDTSRPE